MAMLLVPAWDASGGSARQPSNEPRKAEELSLSPRVLYLHHREREEGGREGRREREGRTEEGRERWEGERGEEGEEGIERGRERGMEGEREGGREGENAVIVLQINAGKRRRNPDRILMNWYPARSD